ncbi:MAG TPA: vWA domain-containing protein [Lunatimonas sp.]|nr:vWA domain-containing protein [Lunatimonas sp.]
MRTFSFIQEKGLYGLILLVLLVKNPVQAQDFNFPSCVGGIANHEFPAILKEAVMGNINITATGASPTMTIENITYTANGVEFEFCSSCSSNETVLGININASGSTVTVSGTPAPEMDNLQFTIQAQSGGDICQTIYSLPIARKPLDLVMVLDRSGSMECPPGDYNWAACIAANFNDSRWSKLKTAINLVATKMVEEAIPGDRLSIVLFDGAIKTSASVGVDAAMLTGFVASTDATFEAKVSALMDDQVQPLGRNGTAIGTSMKDAVNRLPVDDNKLRVIMLFTDGEQNRPPNVRDFNPDLGKYVEDGGPFFLNNGTDPYTINIFTVGFGTLPYAYNTLLLNMASDPLTNYFSTTTGNDGTFGTFISTGFVNEVFSHNSPQNVTERRGNAATGFREKVTINNDIKKIYLEAQFDREIGRLYRFSAWHDGQDVTRFAKKIRMLGSAVIFVFDQENLDRAGLKIPGTWELRANILQDTPSNLQNNYTFSATADDHSLDMQFNSGADKFKPGDKVQPSVKITKFGKALSGAKITAQLIGPTDDVADIIALEEIKAFEPSQDPDAGSLYTQKLGKLLEINPDYLDKFTDNNPTNTISLSEAGNDGTYSGEFQDELTLSGVHNLIFLIEHIADGDTIRRQKRLSLLVRPDDMDLNQSNLELNEVDNQLLLSITPTDKRGRRLGLGLNFHLTASGANIRSIQENLDGSYVLAIDGNLSGPGSIYVSDLPVFEGNLNQLSCYAANASFLKKIECWLWGLGLPAWTIWIIMLLIILILYFLWRRFSES